MQHPRPGGHVRRLRVLFRKRSAAVRSSRKPATAAKPSRLRGSLSYEMVKSHPWRSRRSESLCALRSARRAPNVVEYRRLLVAPSSSAPTVIAFSIASNASRTTCALLAERALSVSSATTRQPGRFAVLRLTRCLIGHAVLVPLAVAADPGTSSTCTRTRWGTAGSARTACRARSAWPTSTTELE